MLSERAVVSIRSVGVALVGGRRVMDVIVDSILADLIWYICPDFEGAIIRYFMRS